MKGRRITASLLALYAVVESSRLQDKRLYVAFVDVKKAFPSCNRALLFRKMSSVGASDRLVRALSALYEEAQGTVRGPGGFDRPFDIRIGTREGGVESPLLYILFVCDLIARFDAALLADRGPLLDGREIRALQLADDLAIMARSAADLEILLRVWEAFCDEMHVETQIKKTEVVPFLGPDEEDSYIEGTTFFESVTRKGRRIIDDHWWTYKGARLRVVETFVYLGVLFDWREDGTAGWADREGTAIKAFGALMGTLFLVPFLPFERVIEVVSSIVGGGYLYGAEIWAPFIPRTGASPGSRISKQVLTWLTGLHGARVARCRGWVMLRELDVEAESRAVRILADAGVHGGLLARAVRL